MARSIVPIRNGDDVVRVRQEVRRYALEAGLGLVDQTKIVTAASELARNTLDYGKGGQAVMDLVQSGARRGVRRGRGWRSWPHFPPVRYHREAGRFRRTSDVRQA